MAPLPGTVGGCWGDPDILGDRYLPTSSPTPSFAAQALPASPPLARPLPLRPSSGWMELHPGEVAGRRPPPGLRPRRQPLYFLPCPGAQDRRDRGGTMRDAGRARPGSVGSCDTRSGHHGAGLGSDLLPRPGHAGGRQALLTAGGTQRVGGQVGSRAPGAPGRAKGGWDRLLPLSTHSHSAAMGLSCGSATPCMPEGKELPAVAVRSFFLKVCA